MKIALFDFCETIVKFQSADPYVWYVAQKYNRKKTCLAFLLNLMGLLKIDAILFKLGFNIYKKLVLYQLKGIPEIILLNEGTCYYNEIIKPNLIQDVLSEIERLKSEGYKLFVVSGGYNVYLKDFIKDFNFDGLICSTLSFHDSLFTGRLEQADCMGVEKVKRLQDFFSCNDMKNIDSISFSDSLSDKPMLDFTRTAVVVGRKDNNWRKVYNYNFKQWGK